MKKDLTAILLLLLITSGFCYELIVEGRSPIRGDIVEQFYPWKSYVYESVMNGELPYWNPFTFGGSPLLANMQSGVFYPLDWIVLLTFPLERFYGISLWLHLCLAGVGAFLFAKKSGANSFPSLLAGVAYGLNGFTMIHIPFGNHLTYTAAAWIPWLMWATTGFVRSQDKKIKWALFGVFIAFLHFLCGHPQMAFYSLFFSMLFCLVYTVWLHIRIERRPAIFSLFRIAAWFAVLCLGIFLAGFQLIPTLEYAELANRAAPIRLEEATEFSFAPHRLISLLFPEYYGTHIGDNHYDSYVYWSCAYAGVIVPILAVYALLMKPREGVVIPLLIVAFFGLLLAWGRDNPFYAFWYQLPVFGSFRAPAKYLPYYITAVCTLAALGLDRLCANAYRRLRETPPVSTSTQRYVMLAVCWIVVFVFGYQVFSEMTGYIRTTERGNEKWIQLLSVSIGFCMVLAGGTLYFLSRHIPNYPRMAISISLAALTALDLFVFGRGYLAAAQLLNESQMKTVSALPQEIGFLQSREEEGGHYRVATLKDIYAPNRAILWHVYNIAGYDPMSLQTYNQQVAEMEQWEEGSYQDNIQLSNFEHPSLDVLNVKYVLTTQVIQDESLEFMYAGENFRVYNRTSDRIAWGWSSSENNDSAVPDEWEPNETVELVSYSPHAIQFSTSFDQDAWVKVSEWHYPGWQAFIAGDNGTRKELRVHKTGGGWRAMYIPAGSWMISMEYHASVWGWVLSAFALLIVVGLILVERMLATGSFFKVVQYLMGRDY